MKLAYGTYATPSMRYEEAIPLLAGIGYEGVELCVSPKHAGAALEELSPARRRDIRARLDDAGMGVPAVFVLGHLLARDDAELERTRALLVGAAQLARDVGAGERPVVAMGIGGKTQDYLALRGRAAEQMRTYAETAEAEDFILAGEAHCGAAFDRSERIAWLFDTVGHARFRFHFDIVHLFLADEPIEDAVHALLPYTAHTHVTDAVKHPDGSFDLVLPGQGDLDMTAYVKAMKDAGWDDFITLEVSTRVWSKPDYDPVEAARFCYRTLDRAFAAAGARA